MLLATGFIIGGNIMMYANREQAAELLAERLAGYRGRNPLVLGIPRGAVGMARIIAEALGGELDVVLVHKLGAPGNPEFAIGSVSESGAVYLSADARALGISKSYIDQEVQAQLATLRRRRAQYTPVRLPIDPKDRIVIVIDNGIATGATMIAALRAVRTQQPAQLVAAVAVAPQETLDRIRLEADETVCLAVPEGFFAVSQFFQRFPQVTDEEVIAILSASARALKPHGPDPAR
jgi:predicted phosphoribosyltransferase